MANVQPKKTLSMSVKTSKKKEQVSKKRPREEPESEPESEVESEVEVEGEERTKGSGKEDSEGSAESEDDSIGSSSEEEKNEAQEAEGDTSDDELLNVHKRSKKSKTEETDNFANAMNALLDTRLKAYDRKDPILVRSKKELKKFDDEKLEQKAKRLLLNEKKKKLTANRNKELLPTDDRTARQVLDHEKKLKKTAQRGVIKLFNAILMTQSSTENDINREKGILGQSKKKELVNEISKEKFLDLVQKAGK
ncbi:uncharacterized protein C5L36_0B10990 [Pichia kudriavzevii]|uniref:Ribosomal RNA-processing protein 15 n=1 Tax=Pichia kudriavzevii TaxID=4909 RepID=A0A2U9R3K9_PICKU|nr:uncharacterized protein C5L36_0B10990 [Pichia kudriavzevii]AWU75863.1 hypothetical protein C5L36_0B10990 [Pichia kudriavzevii]